MTRATYHHGDLRRALIDATATLITEHGPAGFSLRKVASRAGVSPSAPSHHFGSTRGLLTAVAIEGFERLIDRFEAIDARLDPHPRLVAHARAYVDLGITAPGHMAVMFRRDLVDATAAGYVAVAPRSFDLIAGAVADALGDVEGADIECATKTIWSTCHGIASLYPASGPSLEDDLALAHLVDQATSIVYLGMRAVPASPAE